MVTEIKHPKQAIRHIKRMVLLQIHDIIERSKANNPTGRIPNGLISGCIDNYKPVAPWLTYNMILGFYRTRVRENTINKEVVALEEGTDENSASSNLSRAVAIMRAPSELVIGALL